MDIRKISTYVSLLVFNLKYHNVLKYFSKFYINSLYIATLGDLDIVEFKLSEFRNENFTFTYNNFAINKILYQPELSTRFIKLNRKDSYFAIINRSICAKLIKRNIIINIINYIGKKYTEEHLLIYEDTIMALSLFKIAKSYFLMKEEGYYYSRSEYQNKISPEKDYEISMVKFLEFLFSLYFNLFIFHF